VSQCASAQVRVDGPRVCLEKLSGGVDCLIIRFALYCWKEWMWEALHDVLDGGILHLDVGRTGVPGCCAGEETFFGPEAKENGSAAHELLLFVDLF
jgi:hypothetical protein